MLSNKELQEFAVATEQATRFTPCPNVSAAVLTFNVTVVYMARDIIILMRANPFREPLEEVVPKKFRFSGPKPSNGPRNGFAPLKSLSPSAI
jgi:hypothetical protein